MSHENPAAQVPHGEHTVVLKTAADDRIAASRRRGHWRSNDSLFSVTPPACRNRSCAEVSAGVISHETLKLRRSVSDAPVALRPILIGEEQAAR